MSIQNFADWLYGTPFSTAIRETSWIIPNVQSVHILAIAVIVGSALVTELRFAGVMAVDRSPSETLQRYIPWMRNALLVLLVTGIILVIAEPGRTLGNTVFWIKMVLVAGASLITLRGRHAVLLPVQSTNGASATDALTDERIDSPDNSRLLAWVMILVWCVIIFCGRFIAYI